MLNTILIVDDEKNICHILQKYFKSKGYNVKTAFDGRSAITTCRTSPIDLVLLDLRLPDMDGLKLLKEMKTIHPGTGVIIITGYGDIATAVNAIKAKADNFVLKPLDLEVLNAIVEKCLTNYRLYSENIYLKRKITPSASIKMFKFPEDVNNAIHLLAQNPSTNVLILGETGTGKGVVASRIHDLGKQNGQFVDINCAGLSPQLLESELFGHESGAFTDAKKAKRGLLEVAHGGSLFLDEIAEMSRSVQAKILKVIESQTFRRLGGTVNINVHVRIMAATNIDLENSVKKNKFREDLYFRLNVMPVKLPPLRERRDDIVPLAKNFLSENNGSFQKKITGFSPEAEGILIYYSWPGNIRELKNVIERAVLLCEDDEIRTMHLPTNLVKRPAGPTLDPGDDWSLAATEKQHIKNVLAACKDNRSRATKLLKIHRSTLIKKIKQYGL